MDMFLIVDSEIAVQVDLHFIATLVDLDVADNPKVLIG